MPEPAPDLGWWLEQVEQSDANGHRYIDMPLSTMRWLLARAEQAASALHVHTTDCDKAEPEVLAGECIITQAAKVPALVARAEQAAQWEQRCDKLGHCVRCLSEPTQRARADRMAAALREADDRLRNACTMIENGTFCGGNADQWLLGVSAFTRPAIRAALAPEPPR